MNHPMQTKKGSSFARALLALGMAMIFTSAFSAQAPEDDSAGQASSPTDAGDIVVVVGAGGTDDYAEQFNEWAQQWQEVGSLSGMAIQRIGLRNTTENSPATNRASADETAIDDRERLKTAIEQLAKSSQKRPIWIVLIGHGTFARGVAKFNLRGPDIAAKELSSWLQAVERPLVIVNTASSSGPFINQLSAPNRVIVTATKSGTQQNFARFGKYFTEALASPSSDLDHDDEVSVLEAFLKASSQVQQWYETKDRIATESALVDDNADGKGTPAEMFRGTRPVATATDGAELDGSAAAKVTLVPSGERLELTESERQRREELEAELEVLRGRKEELDEQAYDAELENILVKLARIYADAEARERQKTPNP